MIWIKDILLRLPLALACIVMAAQASAADIEDFGRLPEFEAAALSDDGEKIALLATIDGQRLVLVRKDGKFIKKLTVGDEKVRDLWWAGSDHLLIATSQTETLVNFNVDQAEFTRLLVLPIDDTPVQTVFAKQRSIFSSVFGMYGERIVGGVPYLFVGGIPLEADKYAPIKEYRFRGGKPQLYKVNLLTMDAKRVDTDASYRETRRWLIGSNGEIAARLEFDRDNGEFEITNGQRETLLKGKQPDGRIRMRGLSNDGSSLVYRYVDQEDDQTVYMQIPLAGGQPKELLQDMQIRRLFRDQRSGKIIGYLKHGSDPNDPDRRVFYDENINAKIRKVAKAFPKVNNRIESWSTDFDRVVVRTDGNGDSGSWFNVDLANLSASALGYERLAITPEKVGKISTITYTAADGLEIEAILTLPPGKNPTNLPAWRTNLTGPASI